MFSSSKGIYRRHGCGSNEHSTMNILATESPAVIIVGPPWPRSGTARVIQNQIEYYRNRGYTTLFVCVPIHCSFTETYPEWKDIRVGIQELGADRIFFAPIDNRRFNI